MVGHHLESILWTKVCLSCLFGHKAPSLSCLFGHKAPSWKSQPGTFACQVVLNLPQRKCLANVTLRCTLAVGLILLQKGFLSAKHGEGLVVAIHGFFCCPVLLVAQAPLLTFFSLEILKS